MSCWATINRTRLGDKCRASHRSRPDRLARKNPRSCCVDERQFASDAVADAPVLTQPPHFWSLSRVNCNCSARIGFPFSDMLYSHTRVTSGSTLPWRQRWKKSQIGPKQSDIIRRRWRSNLTRRSFTITLALFSNLPGIMKSRSISSGRQYDWIRPPRSRTIIWVYRSEISIDMTKPWLNCARPGANVQTCQPTR